MTELSAQSTGLNSGIYYGKVSHRRYTPKRHSFGYDIAMMALDLLENQAVGIGDHTVNDFMKDATEALTLLTDADDRLETLNKYWGDQPLPF